MKPALVLCLALAACTSMPDQKVEGIDNLTIVEHKLPQMEVVSICGEKLGIPAFMRLLIMPLACATIWLEKWRCDVYYADATARLSLEHERLHCKGYWHDDRLREYRDAYRSNQERDL